jgi:hypothetical protein
MSAFSYSGDPSSSPRDEVRFLTGDTIPDEPLLSDAEVDALLAVFVSPLAAAAEAARRIAALKSRLADKSVDGLSISYSQQSAAYHRLADTLAARTAVPTASANVPRIIFTGTSPVPPFRLGLTSFSPYPSRPAWLSPPV